MTEESTFVLEKSRDYGLALVWDLTAALAREYGVPTSAYTLQKYVAEGISSPWQRMEQYVRPEVLEQIRMAFEGFEGTPWRAVTEVETSHVTFRTSHRDMSFTFLRTTLAGLRIRSSLVTPQGVRLPAENFDLDLEFGIDLVHGQITHLLVLQRPPV